ncbi:MAG TPA: BamA/TamA family outer membrane protein [Longimicrobium sp.]|jgi:hypothetical protein
MSPTSFARSARLGLLAAIAPAGLAAQSIAMAENGGTSAPAPRAALTAEAVPGAAYRAGRVQRMVLGTGYRTLWATPASVEVLDVASYAGGLTPTRTGGDFSTRSLRFRGADGLEYVFRPVDKDVTQGLHPHLKNTMVDRVVQDQVSVALPGAVLVASALQTAAGVRHAPPRLVVLPDDASLGAFRAEFAGRLGTIEERPGDTFGGAAAVEATEEMLSALATGPAHRADAEAYLNARLLDVVMGDWDRHDGQWRWARFDRGGTQLWTPIARDRDNAFSRHGGLVATFGRGMMPKLVTFDSTMAGLRGLTDNAQHLDRQLLSGLSKETWDATVRSLQARLTDAAIDEAVRRLPGEHYSRAGATLAYTLRARRDQLPTVADAFYRQLAEVVDVHATDASERVTVERMADGAVLVKVAPRTGGEPTFSRRFAHGETREIRIHLAGGDDAAIVTGAAPITPLVRVIGGAGDDTLRDESPAAAGRRTVFHDSEGTNAIAAGTGARVDTRAYTRPVRARSFDNPEAEQDRGTTRSFGPHLGYTADAGPIVGGAMTWTTRGFRREGFAQRQRIRAEFAPMQTGFALDVQHIGRGMDGTSLLVHARASQIDPFRFHGFGNETANDGPRDRYLVDQTVVTLESEVGKELGSGLRLGVGPAVRYRSASADEDTPFFIVAPLGTDAYTTAGLRSTMEWDGRDAAAFPTRGGWARVTAEGHRGMGGDVGGFGRARGEGAAYLPVIRGTTLAMRAGGERVWGEFPVQEAAFLGGGESLRGFSRKRFAGDAAVWGNAELRASLGTANLAVTRGNLGAIVLADAGRVYFDGRSEGGWHPTYGGGLYFSMLDRAYTGTIIAARGEDGWKAYVKLGLPF